MFDAREHAEAAAMLRELEVSFTRPSVHQLQIGRNVNYWPGKGTIYVMGESCRRVERGLGALRDVLIELNIASRSDLTRQAV